MDDALGMGVLGCSTHLHDQLDACLKAEILLSCERRDGKAVDELHCEERASRTGLPRRDEPGVEHPRDVRVLKLSERSAFQREATQHAGGIHARFDHLQRHTPIDWLALKGLVHDAEATLANLADNAVGTDGRRHGLQAVDDGAQAIVIVQRFEKARRLLVEGQ